MTQMMVLQATDSKQPGISSSLRRPGRRLGEQITSSSEMAVDVVEGEGDMVLVSAGVVREPSEPGVAEALAVVAEAVAEVTEVVEAGVASGVEVVVDRVGAGAGDETGTSWS